MAEQQASFTRYSYPPATPKQCSRTYTLRYGRTVNLGHYESARIELEEVFDATVPRDQALKELAGRVEEWAENRKKNPQAR
jgi:hypothetical protein